MSLVIYRNQDLLVLLLQVDGYAALLVSIRGGFNFLNNSVRSPALHYDDWRRGPESSTGELRLKGLALSGSLSQRPRTVHLLVEGLYSIVVLREWDPSVHRRIGYASLVGKWATLGERHVTSGVSRSSSVHSVSGQLVDKTRTSLCFRWSWPCQLPVGWTMWRWSPSYKKRVKTPSSQDESYRFPGSFMSRFIVINH